MIINESDAYGWGTYTETHKSQPKGSSFANTQTVRGPLSSNICQVAIGNLARRQRNHENVTLRPRCTPSSVGWTYSGQHSSMNLAKQKKASSSEGMVYRNGAASTFIPWTYVNPSCWVSCLSTGPIILSLPHVEAIVLTMTAPHKSIQQTDEHIFSYSFLKTSICS